MWPHWEEKQRDAEVSHPRLWGSCHEDRILFVSYDMILLLSKCPDSLMAFLSQHRE